MSKLNTFELQSQVYAKLSQGKLSKEVWDDYRNEEAREAHRHLVADGNPTSNDYNSQIKGLIENMETNIKGAKEIGALAEQELVLKMRSVCLAGSVLRSLVSVVPKTIPEATALFGDYQALAQEVGRETLEAASSHLGKAEQAVYQLDIVRLYGEADAKEA